MHPAPERRISPHGGPGVGRWPKISTETGRALWFGLSTGPPAWTVNELARVVIVGFLALSILLFGSCGSS